MDFHISPYYSYECEFSHSTILKSEEVKRIHLAATDAPFLNSIQFYHTSDKHFVYCHAKAGMNRVVSC
ncbi:type II toxin-antitoxin system YafO family toxin [Vibrio pelagius]|uniref:type II toxin-antitoxin system YafO family toxin n=1 Tax=Vibrio pelagius TaxID=28169 RepID=UPI003B830E03